jgi:hypothetical protein
MPKYDEPLAYRFVQRRDGDFNVDDRGVIHIRPLRAEANPAPYHRVLRILRWVSEVASVGLVEDQRLLAALGDFEHALVAIRHSPMIDADHLIAVVTTPLRPSRPESRATPGPMSVAREKRERQGK